jgi:hypothetical protein
MTTSELRINIDHRVHKVHGVWVNTGKPSEP